VNNLEKKRISILTLGCILHNHREQNKQQNSILRSVGYVDHVEKLKIETNNKRSGEHR